MYIVAVTATQRNARRHVLGRYYTLEDAERHGGRINKRYTVELYDGAWKLIKVLQKGEKKTCRKTK